MNRKVSIYDSDEEEERERRQAQAKFNKNDSEGDNSIRNNFRDIGIPLHCHSNSKNENSDDDDFEKTNFIIKQSLQIINIWEKSYSNPRLQFDITNKIVSRQDHYEINPVVVTRCFSYSCCITFIVKYSRKINNEFSFGIIDMDKYAYDFNLSDVIGKLPNTWGVHEDTISMAKLRLQGKPVKNLSIIRNQDKVSIIFDLNSSNRYEGKCYFLINDRLVHCIQNLTCDVNYGVAAILPPQYALEIIPNRVVDMESMITDSLEQHSDCKEEEKVLFSTNSCLEEDPRRESKDHRSTVPDQVEKHNAKPTPVPAFFPSSKNVLAPPSSNIISSSKTNTHSSSGLECCVCLSANKCVLFLPCKHICVCEECGILRSPPITHCPVCREIIKSKTKVFL
jgi:hypothetical protein